jgi:hypothetical protein
MYLRPFLLIQVLAFLITEIGASLRLRAFALEMMEKLEALTNAGYVALPLPKELYEYLHFGPLAKTGVFFTLTVGFTLGLVAFMGALFLHQYRVSKRKRLIYTLVISGLLSLLFGFHVVEFLLLLALFGLAHYAISIPRAPLHKTALLSVVPLLIALFLVLFGLVDNVFFRVRDGLLQTQWGESVVAFYYLHSPLAAELIMPPTQKTQVTISTPSRLGPAPKRWLLKKGIYVVEDRRGSDIDLTVEVETGQDVVEAIESRMDRGVLKWVKGKARFTIILLMPLVSILVLIVLVTDRLHGVSRYTRFVVIGCVIGVSAALILHGVSRKNQKGSPALRGERTEDIRRWTSQENPAIDTGTADRLLRSLRSDNPALRLWAATALARIPSRDHVEVLKAVARQDPVPIVRCKAVLALSHQGDRKVIPFLEPRLKGREDWYVKHYLFRALRRLGWVG